METLDLTPAAGSGIGRKFATALVSDDELVKHMKAAAMDGLQATTGHFDKAVGWVETPDFKTRLAALFGILSHLEGDPLKRVLHQHSGLPAVNFNEMSPATIAAAEREIAKTKFRTRRQKPAAPPAEPGPPGGGETLDLA